MQLGLSFHWQKKWNVYVVFRFMYWNPNPQSNSIRKLVHYTKRAPLGRGLVPSKSYKANLALPPCGIILKGWPKGEQVSRFSCDLDMASTLTLVSAVSEAGESVFGCSEAILSKVFHDCTPKTLSLWVKLPCPLPKYSQNSWISLFAI